MIFDLTRDFLDALAAMPADHPRRRILALLEEAVRRDIHFIARHPTTLFQCMWNTCWWYDCPEAAAHYESPEGGQPAGEDEPLPAQPGTGLCAFMGDWRRAREARQTAPPWLASRKPPPQPLGTAEKAVIGRHDAPALCMACSADGKQIASGAGDGTVRVWDAQTGMECSCLRGHAGGVQGVAFFSAGTRIVSGSDDGTVRVWDAETGAELLCLRGHEAGVRSLACSPDGTRILSGANDCTVRLWDSRTGAELACLRGHARDVRCVAFSPDGRMAASASVDKTVRLWDLGQRAESRCLRGHEGAVAAIAFSPDGRWLASGSLDATVRLWEVGTGAARDCLHGHGKSVNALAFLPDGRRLAAGSGDGTVRLWTVEGSPGSHVLGAHEGPVTCVAALPDGRHIASGGWDGVGRLWAVERVGGWRRLAGHRSPICSTVFSPCGNYLLTAADNTWSLGSTEEKSVVFWDVGTGLLRGCMTATPKECATGVSYSPDGTRFGVAMRDRSARIREVATAELVLALTGHEDFVRASAFSPDGRYVVTVSNDTTGIVWDIQERRSLCRLRGHTGWVECVAFSPDGTRIATGSADGTVRVWDAMAGAELCRIPCMETGEGAILGVAFRPDTEAIAAVCSNGTSGIWETRGGRCVLMRQGTTDASALAAGPAAHPWLALAKGPETVVESARTGKVLAWFPWNLANLASHPQGTVWAGALRSNLCLFALERPPRAAAPGSADAGPQEQAECGT
jgi:WD40 repeat protein